MTLRPVLAALLIFSPLAAGVPALAADDAPRIVSVSGEGEIVAQPDIAFVTLGVEARRPTMAEARAEVSKTVDAVLALTRSLKIDPKLVNSTRLQVQPEYSWNERDRQRVLLGYIVSRQVEIELRDLEQLGPLMERAVDAGVNQVGDARLDSSRRKDLEREAMALAVKDARLNAETLAGAAGARLGAVRSLAASSSPPVMPMFRAEMMKADAMVAAAPPAETYQPGEMRFRSQVSAQYDLVPGGQ
jgi:uncharacterized protein YggE